MKRISLKSYESHMGTLIDLSNPIDYQTKHDPRAKNIPYQNLMLHYHEYLQKDLPYYLMCSKGVHSGKATSLLEYLGYDVTQVINV